MTPTRQSFSYLGTAHWLGIPVLIWLLAIAFAIGAILLSRSVYGRAVYIVGGNDEAARLSGMRVSVIQASTYAITSLTAALAGMLSASQTGVGQANVGGDITLDAIAIVIIGGTSLRGGQGAMWRTLVGLADHRHDRRPVQQPGVELVRPVDLQGRDRDPRRCP